MSHLRRTSETISSALVMGSTNTSTNTSAASTPDQLETLLRSNVQTQKFANDISVRYGASNIEFLISVQMSVLELNSVGTNQPTSEPLRLLPSPYKPSDSMSTKDQLLEAVSIIKEISGVRVFGAEIKRTKPPYDRFGPTIIVTVDGDASEALKIWVKAARKVRGKGFILKVRWTGRTDVSPEEFIEYYARAEEEMDIPPFVDPNFDSVKAVRMSRDDD
jgi:hypothetical protein